MHIYLLLFKRMYEEIYIPYIGMVLWPWLRLDIGLCQLKIRVKVWKHRRSKLKDATSRLLFKEWKLIHHMHWFACFHCSLLKLQHCSVFLNLPNFLLTTHKTYTSFNITGILFNSLLGQIKVSLNNFFSKRVNKRTIKS